MVGPGRTFKQVDRFPALTLEGRLAGRSMGFPVRLRWTGDAGVGTKDYRSYGRGYTIEVDGKPELPGSSSPAFRGDPSRHDPEDLLVASLSACHMLWYLHLCAERGIVVREYEDAAAGTLALDERTDGRFVEVRLNPRVGIERGDPDLARSLHDVAHARCYIARSVNFPVHVSPTISVRSAAEAGAR